MLQPPPFKLASGALGEVRAPACCAPGAVADARPGRLKLAELDTHFQCSVIGTCMSTAALRKTMSRFIDVQGATDLAIHHEAVLMASEPGPASKALHKALDHLHEAVLQRFARVHDAVALGALWQEALGTGDIPGAYWALLTHRHAGTELRAKVFGDVHMLSHLVGAANRADIRRLVALEQANAELRERIDRQHEQYMQQEQALQQLRGALEEARAESVGRGECIRQPDIQDLVDKAENASRQVALQTQRRETAEQLADTAEAGAARLLDEVVYLRKHAAALLAELAAAEGQLRELAEDQPLAAVAALRDRRVLYVGGRPSSTASIRALVQRHGGDFRHHDGGLEDRKGLLAAGVGWAQVVVFPVDCVDHDSVGVLKRVCARQGIRFLPLRSAGVGCFAAAFADIAAAGPG